MVQAALATFVLFSPERAATPALVAGSFAILLLPYSLLGPFAGVLLDRWRRRQVLLVASLVQAALTVGLATIAARGSDGPDLAVTVLLVLAVNRFVLAAISAGTPHVVPTAYLVTANAIAPTLGTAASVLGGLLGVALRGLNGNGDHGSVVILGVAAGCFVLTALVATTLGADQLGPPAGRHVRSLASVARGLVAGLARLAERPRAARGIALVAVQRGTFGMATALAVLQVRGALNPAGDPAVAVADLALVVALAGAGALLAALLTPKVVTRVDPVSWSAAAVAGGVGLGAVAGATASLPGLLTMGLLVGFGGQAAKVCTDARVQSDIDDRHLGRVFSLYDMAVNVAIVLGLTVAVLLLPVDGRSLLVPVLMALVAVTAAALAVLAERRDRLPVAVRG
jgi:MFS family permease